MESSAIPPVRFRYIGAASIRRVFPFLPSLIEGLSMELPYRKTWKEPRKIRTNLDCLGGQHPFFNNEDALTGYVLNSVFSI